MTNITERKRAEARLRELAAMLDLAHDAIIVRSLARSPDSLLEPRRGNACTAGPRRKPSGAKSAS